jgi:pimeloyl-ACP methyl ester carboxylesterase
MAQILYIHGIGNHGPAEPLKREWDLALFGREMGERAAMAYWADILHPQAPARSPAKAPKRVGKRQADSAALDIDALLREAGVSPKNADAQHLARSMLRAYGVAPPGPRAKVLPLPAFLRKPVARAFLSAFIKDTAAYFFRKGVRERVQARLRAVLAAADPDEPLTLIAHSQGTIVALEVLAELGDAQRVEQFVTLGSPLGIREVQDFLSCELRVPAGVARWHNFADPLDPVALDKGLRADFDPENFIVDDVIVNARTRTLQGFNPHSSVGYLAHPKVRAVVYDAARIDKFSRFLIARDVAASLAVEARHPVLIEILEPGYRAIDEDLASMRAHEASAEQGNACLVDRIERAAQAIETLVGKANLKDARIDRLRRFVAARLTPSELAQVAHRHRDLRVYAVWRSSPKRKLIRRSASVIHVDAARASYGAQGERIRWAVLDTGVRTDHPHFGTHDSIEEVWDCTQPGAPKRLKTDADRDGHGTHVCGIVAGADPKGQHLGMAPRAKLVVYKVLDDSGMGEDAWIIKALDHIAARNESASELAIHGLNLSLGGPYDSTVYGCGYTPICVELRRQWRAGVLVCVASGNEGQVEVATPQGALELNSPMSIGDPANLEDCIAVGSVNADKPLLHGISAFSSRGPTSDGRVKPDVVAPGERITSCNSRYKSGAGGSASGDLYRADSGTSMAAPHVSGLLAAFLSVRREYIGRPDEVKKLLLETSTDLGRDKYHQGHGVPNLMQMLLRA